MTELVLVCLGIMAAVGAYYTGRAVERVANARESLRIRGEVDRYLTRGGFGG